MALAVVLVLISVGSVIFHFLSPWWSTPAASNWSSIDDTLSITLIITATIFILINLFIVYCLVRFRYHKRRRADYQPENKKLEYWLIGLTSVGIVAMLAPGLFVYAEFVTPPDDAAEFEVLGQQWQWSYRFPGKDQIFGASHARFINADNPFGLDPDDSKGQDDILISSNDLHLPLDQTYKVQLRSKDVLHDFYVPQFRVKMDMVPGLVTNFWFTPTKIGRFEVLCAEFCGVSHFNMRGAVLVEPEEEFQTWLASYPTFAQSLLSEPGIREVHPGETLAQEKGCLACHRLDDGKGIGPGWQGLFGKTETLVGGGTVLVDEDYLKESILNPSGAVVAGFSPVMPPYQFSEQELNDIIDFIKTLKGGQDEL